MFNSYYSKDSESLAEINHRLHNEIANLSKMIAELREQTYRLNYELGRAEAERKLCRNCDALLKLKK